MNLNAMRSAVAARIPRGPRAGGLGAWPPTRSTMGLAVAAAVLVFGIALLATEASRVSGTTAPVAGPELGRSESAGLPVGFDLVAKLVVVLGLIYASATLARRYLLKVPSGSQGLLRVLDSTMIAPKKSVYVVEIAGRVLLIGTTESAMSTLTQFDDPETVASLVASARPSGIGFQRYLEASLSRGTNPAAATASQPLDLLAQAATRLRTGNDR